MRPRTPREIAEAIVSIESTTPAAWDDLWTATVIVGYVAVHTFRSSESRYCRYDAQQLARQLRQGLVTAMEEFGPELAAALAERTVRR